MRVHVVSSTLSGVLIDQALMDGSAVLTQQAVSIATDDRMHDDAHQFSVSNLLMQKPSTHESFHQTKNSWMHGIVTDAGPFRAQ